MVMRSPQVGAYLGGGARATAALPHAHDAPVSGPAPREQTSAPAPPAAEAAEPARSPGVAEWYVGIDGEPVGPVPPSYLVSQAAAGKVTLDSLVWREQMTDWRPLRTVVELRGHFGGDEPAAAGVADSGRAPAADPSQPVALTRLKPGEEAAAAGAPPAAPPVVDDADTSGVHAKPPTEALAGAAPPPAEPAAKPEPATALEPAATAAGSIEPAAKIEPASVEPAKAEAALKLGDRAPARAPVESAPDSTALLEEQLRAKERRRKRRGVHPMAWALVAMCAAFGGVAAWFVFGPQERGGGTATPPSAAVPVAQAPGATAAAPTATGGDSGAITLAPVAVDPNAPAGAGAGKVAPAGSVSTAVAAAGDASKPATPATCAPDDPFCNQGGPKGPDVKGPAGTGAATGQGLTPEEAQRVVASKRSAVSRKCLSYVTGGGKAASARVTVAITVAPSGAVQAANASGGNEFPGLAGCIASSVRAWSFPPSAGTTQINVPFVLVAQD
jgi:hypothetical protein